ncbi:transposase [Candidatus Poriferisodalis sp.]|uniref:transposase n=1 Tax=Candidatus Poriferisodalis sp. TaxID=3101277 RepID=UPI003B02BEA9
MEAFRGRRLDHIEFPFVCLDAAYLKVRNSVGQPTSTATVVGAILADLHDERQATDRRYLSEDSMSQLHRQPATATPAEIEPAANTEAQPQNPPLRRT